MAYQQDAVAAIVSCMSEMDRTFSVKQCRARLLHKNAPCIRQLHLPALFMDKKGQAVQVFEFGDLPAERRLADMKSIGGSSEVEFFSQDGDRVEVTYFNIRKHCAKARRV